MTAAKIAAALDARQEATYSLARRLSRDGFPVEIHIPALCRHRLARRATP